MSTYGNEPENPYGVPPEGQMPPPGGDIPPSPPPAYGQPDYGAPTQGGPSYGQTPPPPPPGGYGGGGQGGNSRPYSVGEAFNYGWTKFQANIGPIILAVLAMVGSVIVIQVIGFIISGAMTSASTPTIEYNSFTGAYETSGGSGGLFGAAFLVSMIFGFFSYAVVLVIQAGIIKGSLSITYGREITLKEMFSGLNFLQIAIASVIIGVATTVGFILCVLPGLVVMFFSWFTLHFVIDKNMPALEAIKASFAFVNKNLGSLIGFFIAALLAYFVGALLCGIGLLLAIPVVIIAQAYTYRTLQGETAAA